MSIPVYILCPLENCYQTKQMVHPLYQTIGEAVKYAGLHNSQLGITNIDFL